MSPEADLEPLAQQFSVVAACIQERRRDADVTDAIDRAASLAQELSRTVKADRAQALSSNLKTALETWRTVWPRMGKRQEFRLAVAREAALWARRLRTPGPGARSHGG